MAKKPDDQFTKKEAQQRFEAALRGARVTGPKPKPTPERKVKATKRKPGK
jgi:hypothetical protein